MHSVPAFEAKLCTPADVAARVARLARPLVFTNGVFDILHRGHASYLAQARGLGVSLIVAVNGDASVQRLGKGPDRPINALADRMALIAALESVSLVTWFDDDTPLALIKIVRPDVLVKGGDWAIDDIVAPKSQPQLEAWQSWLSSHHRGRVNERSPRVGAVWG